MTRNAVPVESALRLRKVERGLERPRDTEPDSTARLERRRDDLHGRRDIPEHELRRHPHHAIPQPSECRIAARVLSRALLMVPPIHLHDEARGGRTEIRDEGPDRHLTAEGDPRQPPAANGRPESGLRRREGEPHPASASGDESNVPGVELSGQGDLPRPAEERGNAPLSAGSVTRASRETTYIMARGAERARLGWCPATARGEGGSDVRGRGRAAWSTSPRALFIVFLTTLIVVAIALASTPANAAGRHQAKAQTTTPGPRAHPRPAAPRARAAAAGREHAARQGPPRPERSEDAGREAAPFPRGQQESGLVHMGARSYEPGTGLFLSVDPHSGFGETPYSYYAYQYAYGNPGRYVDPNGEWIAREWLGEGNENGPGLFGIAPWLARRAVQDVQSELGPGVLSGTLGAIGGVATTGSRIANGLVDVLDASGAATYSLWGGGASAMTGIPLPDMARATDETLATGKALWGAGELWGAAVLCQNPLTCTPERATAVESAVTAAGTSLSELGDDLAAGEGEAWMTAGGVAGDVASLVVPFVGEARLASLGGKAQATLRGLSLADDVPRFSGSLRASSLGARAPPFGVTGEVRLIEEAISGRGFAGLAVEGGELRGVTFGGRGAARGGTGLSPGGRDILRYVKDVEAHEAPEKGRAARPRLLPMAPEPLES